MLACLGYKGFLTSFENFIGGPLFYGLNGKIQWWACTCYVITLAVQVPFLDQLFYAGPLVKPLGGADISWMVGIRGGIAAVPGWGEALRCREDAAGHGGFGFVGYSGGGVS